jgi:hypothetical protein
MADMLAKLWVHTVTVTPFLGTGRDGADTFGAPVTVTGFLQDATRLVQGVDGSQLVSTGAVFFTAVANAVHFPLGSRVVLPLRTAEVTDVNTNDSGPLGLPDHTVVALT